MFDIYILIYSYWLLLGIFIIDKVDVEDRRLRVWVYDKNPHISILILVLTVWPLVIYRFKYGSDKNAS
jgi:hypothetical protein